MKKIGVAGLQREQIKKTIEATAPGSFEVFIHNDMEAAMKVKSGQLEIAEGKVAFGLSVEHVEHAIPMLINHLK